MISVRPQEAVNILNANQTLLIRKSMPKDYKGWVNIYVMKYKPYLFTMFTRNFLTDWYADEIKERVLNGKVIARFWLEECENDLEKYGKGKPVYAWHIKKLEIFDEPLELSEFGITKAPSTYQWSEINILLNRLESNLHE